MAVLTPTENRIRPCAGPCGRMTRPSSLAKSDYPDTVTRQNGTHCGTCFRGVAAEQKPEGRELTAAAEARRTQRLADAEQARKAYEAQRAARAKARIPRRVSMGQSMVRI